MLQLVPYLLQKEYARARPYTLREELYVKTPHDNKFHRGTLLEVIEQTYVKVLFKDGSFSRDTYPDDMQVRKTVVKCYYILYLLPLSQKAYNI